MIFGENILALLVLALGAALAVGNVLALVRPRNADEVDEGEVARPPLARTLLMIGLGLLATIWALASLATDDDPVEEPAAALQVNAPQ